MDTVQGAADAAKRFKEQNERRVAEASAGAARVVSNAVQDQQEWAGRNAASLSDRARGFWKEYNDTLQGLYDFAGSHWQGCAVGAEAGAAGGFVVGSIIPVVGTTVGAAGGGVGGCAAAVGTEVGTEEVYGP